MRRYNLFLIWSLLVLVAPVASYLHVEVTYPGSIYGFTIIYFILSILLWGKLPFKNLGRVMFIVTSFILGAVVTFGLVLLTMFLPGSKEHNYVMYNVCLPAIRKHYGLKEGDSLQKDGEQVDKNGWGKWWYQHTQCEQNVYDGKGPIFSENPPEFHPVSQK